MEQYEPLKATHLVLLCRDFVPQRALSEFQRNQVSHGGPPWDLDSTTTWQPSPSAPALAVLEAGSSPKPPESPSQVTGGQVSCLNQIL